MPDEPKRAAAPKKERKSPRIRVIRTGKPTEEGLRAAYLVILKHLDAEEEGNPPEGEAARLSYESKPN